MGAVYSFKRRAIQRRYHRDGVIRLLDLVQSEQLARREVRIELRTERRRAEAKDNHQAER